MRKSFSTQRLEKFIKLLTLLTDKDILYLQQVINENIRLRRILNDNILLGNQKVGNQKGTLNGTVSPLLAAQPDEPIARDNPSPAP